MTQVASGIPADKEYVGYGPAAERLGIRRNTLSHYVNTGRGPEHKPGHAIISGRALRVFTEAALAEWERTRPGRGARSDLAAKEAEGEIIGFSAAARRLGIPASRLRRLVKDGEGPAMKWVEGKTEGFARPRFLAENLDEWKKNNA